MNLIEMLKEHSEDVGNGVDKKFVFDLEARLGITIPKDFKEYLYNLNYAELFGDPIYGISPADTMLDIYNQNKSKEHFRYGFLEIFSNDIDGTIYIRPDTGMVYNASFEKAIASSFTEFVKIVLASET